MVNCEVSLINIIIVPDLIQFQKHLTSFDTEPHLQVTIIITFFFCVQRGCKAVSSEGLDLVKTSPGPL